MLWSVQTQISDDNETAWSKPEQINQPNKAINEKTMQVMQQIQVMKENEELEELTEIKDIEEI